METSRGAAVGAAWIVRGDESRRCRGCHYSVRRVRGRDVDSPWRRVAATPRVPLLRERRGRGRDVDSTWRRVAATPRVPRFDGTLVRRAANENKTARPPPPQTDARPPRRERSRRPHGCALAVLWNLSLLSDAEDDLPRRSTVATMWRLIVEREKTVWRRAVRPEFRSLTVKACVRLPWRSCARGYVSQRAWLLSRAGLETQSLCARR